jgi:hypothetical protein
LADQVRAWIKTRDAADQLVTEWQRLEHQLSVQARLLRVDIGQTLASELPASRRMRALAKQIAAADKHLSESADLLISHRRVSTHDALAKIRLGLRLAPFPSGDEAPWLLVKAGFEDLQAMIERAS